MNKLAEKIVEGKLRGGNYHCADNHIVRVIKFTDLIDKEVAIQVFKA